MILSSPTTSPVKGYIKEPFSHNNASRFDFGLTSKWDELPTPPDDSDSDSDDEVVVGSPNTSQSKELR